MRIILLILMMLLPWQTAWAQDLLINGDFEAQQVPIGNNLNLDIVGWKSVVRLPDGTYQIKKANLVGVDGPGGNSWGTPESDATGGNNLQHYIDGIGNFRRNAFDTYVWQHFTAPCDGQVRASIAFSTRRNLTRPSSYSVGPLYAAPVGMPSSQQSTTALDTLIAEQSFHQVSIPHHQPDGSRWLQVGNNIQLQAGQLYTFMVKLDEDANFDNASVEYQNITPALRSCLLRNTPAVSGSAAVSNPGLPNLPNTGGSATFTPGDISLTKTCSAPTTGQYNGVNGMIWDCQISVDINAASNGQPFSGTLVVGDNPASSAGSTIEIMTMSTASGNGNCASGNSCIYGGQSFDASGVELIDVRLFLASSGQQSTNTAQNCVTGGYVDVASGSASLAGNCVDIQWDSVSNTNGGGSTGNASIDTTKACDPIVSLGNGSYSLTCHLTVTGSNLPAGETIVLADFFGGQTGNAMGLLPFLTNFTSNEPWACGALNTNIQGCTLDPADLAAAGGTSTLSTTTVFQNPENHAQAFNCLQIDTAPGFPPPTGKSARPALPKGIKGFATGQTKSAQSQFGDVCVVLDIPKDDDKPVVTGKVQKQCQQLPRMGATINLICEIQVSLSGPASGTVTVGDLFTQLSGSSVSYAAQIGSNDPGWACNNPAYTAQNPMECHISGANLASLGNVSSVWAHFSFPANGYNAATFSNCGTITMGDTPLADPDCIPLGNGNDTGGDGGNDDGGFTVLDAGDIAIANPGSVILDNDGSTPSRPDVIDGGVMVPSLPHLPIPTPVPTTPQGEVRPTKANLQISKKTIGACKVNRGKQSYECRFQLAVKNVGRGRYRGPASLIDQFGQPRPTKFRLTSRNGWSCSRITRGSASCLNPSVNLAPGQASRFEMLVTLPGLRKGGTSRNCARLALPKSSSQRIAMIQQIMNDLGLNAGTVDGKSGKNTFRALSKLKAQLGLPDTRAFDDDLFRALGLGVESKQACARFKLPAMPAPFLKCDRTSTLQKGESCRCRYDGMVQTSPTKCICQKGTKLVKGKGCVRPVVKPRPLPTAPKCDPRSTRARGEGCRCLYNGMVKTSPSKCVCKKGTKLVVGKGCVRPVVKPRPLPTALKCDPRTTRARGKTCVCTVKGSVKISATKCGCRPNAQMLDGRCVPFRTRPTPTKPTPSKPRPDKPVSSKPIKLVPGIKFTPGKALIELKK